MANYLKMPKKQQVLALLDSAGATAALKPRPACAGKRSPLRPGAAGKCGQNVPRLRGVRRPTKPRDPARPTASNAAKAFPGSPSNPAKTFPGSALRRVHGRRAIATPSSRNSTQGLSLQRIWQDLVEEYGYGGQLRIGEAVCADGLQRPRRAVGVYHSAPGDEGQIDFFRGAPTLRRDDRRVATALGLPPDPRPLAPRLRRGGVGSEASRRFCASTSTRSTTSAACPRDAAWTI